MGERARALDGRGRASPTCCRCRRTTSRPSASWTIARETAAESDVVPQVLWRRALARTSARRGDARGGGGARTGAPSRSRSRPTASTCAPARWSRWRSCSSRRETSEAASASVERGAGAATSARGTSQRCGPMRRAWIRGVSFPSVTRPSYDHESHRRWVSQSRAGPGGVVRGQLARTRSPMLEPALKYAIKNAYEKATRARRRMRSGSTPDGTPRDVPVQGRGDLRRGTRIRPPTTGRSSTITTVAPSRSGRSERSNGVVRRS